MDSLIRARRAFTMRPGAPVLEDAAVVAGEDGRIHDVGTWKDLKKSWSFPTVCVQDLGEVDLIPGPLNAHTHLELSHTHGATTLGQGFIPWLKSLLALPLHDLTPSIILDACQSLSLSGTAFVADVASRNAAVVAESLSFSGIEGQLFLEVIGDGALDTDSLMPDSACFAAGISCSLMGHAPYTTSPERLQAAKQWNRQRGLPFAMHLAEHPEEQAFLQGQGGELARMVLGTVLPEDFTPPGMGSVSYVHGLNLLDQKTLAVHCVQLQGEDISLLQSTGATVCLCPRSNQAIGVGRAPVEAMRAAGVPLCLGTDGLCSSPSLEVLDELVALLESMDPAPGLLEAIGWITTTPAEFFGVESRLGMIARGRSSQLGILPPALRDMPL